MSAAGTMAEAVGIPLAARKTEMPSVDWWMTSHCNFACDFCFESVPDRGPVDRRPDIFEVIAACSVPSDLLRWESFLFRNVEVTETVYRAASEPDIGLQFNAVLNYANEMYPLVLAKAGGSDLTRLLAAWSQTWM